MLRNLYRRLPIIRELRELARLQGRILARMELDSLRDCLRYEEELLAKERFGNPKNLNRFEHKFYSQFGEDGIIAEIFRRIGTATRTFLEIGVGDGLENNTTALLVEGWRGAWLEGDPGLVEKIQRGMRSFLETGALKVKKAFVTAENIDSCVKSFELPFEVDLLSLDVDQNTYWIWSSLKALSARLVVIEYNANVTPHLDWSVSYHPDKTWDGSFLYGASLKDYEALGKKLGYTLVGCSLSGVNAFFVRDDLVGDRFEEPFTAEHHYQPPRYHLYRKIGHFEAYPL